MASQAAERASKALVGGAQSSQPQEDSAEVAAIFAVVDTQTDNAGTKIFDVNNGVVKVGRINIPGQQDFYSKWQNGQWDGLDRR